MSNEFVTRAAAQGIELPDPTGAPDGQVVTTASGAYGLAAPAGGIDTSLQAAPDTGWTAAGDGTASISSGVVSQTVTAAQSVAVLRRTIDWCSPHLPAVELIARVTVTPPASGDYYVGLGVLNTTVPNNAGAARGAVVFSSTATTWANLNATGSWTQPASISAPATLASGTLWLRLVYSAGVAAYYAASGATLPTSWTPIHATTAPQLVGLGIDQLSLYAERVGGTGDYEVEWDDIQWRSLLGAPT